MNLFDINAPLEDNMGGLCRISFVEDDGVDTMDDPIAYVIANAVTFVGSARWFNFYCTRDTAFFNEPESLVENGTTYKFNVGGTIPVDQPETLALLRYMGRRKFIVVFTDNNGRQHIAGRPGKGVRFTYTRTSETNPAAGGTKYKCSFYADLDDATPFYQGIVPVFRCLTLVELLIAATISAIKAALVTAGQFIGLVESLNEDELSNLTIAQQKIIIEDALGSTVAYGWEHMGNPTEKMHAFYSISDSNWNLNFELNLNSGTPQTATFFITKTIEFDFLDPDASFNYSAVSYTLNGTSTGLPFTANNGDTVDITLTKPTPAAPGLVVLMGHFVISGSQLVII